MKALKRRRMNRVYLLFLLLGFLLLSECGVMKEAINTGKPGLPGMEGLEANCSGSDSISSVLIKKAEAILIYDKERYEVNLTLYSKRDSIIYLSAVNSGFEILRASVKEDSIKVIDRMNKIVYRAPLKRRFGYQYPVNFHDLQNLIARSYLCDDLHLGRDDKQSSIIFEFDEDYIKKRILLDRVSQDIKIFEFYHQKTDQYIMGEKQEDSFKIFSNFMISDIEIVASGGERSINREIKIKTEVNPKKYTFTELR